LFFALVAAILEARRFDGFANAETAQVHATTDGAFPLAVSLFAVDDRSNGVNNGYTHFRVCPVALATFPEDLCAVMYRKLNIVCSKNVGVKLDAWATLVGVPEAFVVTPFGAVGLPGIGFGGLHTDADVM